MAKPTPYLGSKISLVSKSEIRYEGILYTVDQKEATIALAKVKSFGTEDRRTENGVAPRDEVYEYIIFKASDIKDLMVCETPQRLHSIYPGLAYDPAIVSVSQPPVPNPSPAVLIPSLNVGSSAPPKTTKAPAGSGSSTRSGTPGHGRTSPTVDAGTQAGLGSQNKAPGAGRPLAPSSDIRKSQQQRRPQRQPQQYQARLSAPLRTDNSGERGGGGGRGEFRGGMPFRGRMDSPYHRGEYYGRRVFQQRSPVGYFYNRGRRPQAQTPTQTQTQTEPLKFDKDFDFEKANEKFQETLQDLKEDLTKIKLVEEESGAEEKENSVLGESGQGDSEEKTSFYDHETSFFDRISCEAVERQQGQRVRPNWRKEREMNVETFGQVALRNYQMRRGWGWSRGRGPMMRGGYQRGGYGYYGGGGGQGQGQGQGRPYYGGYNNYYYGGGRAPFYYHRY